MFVAHEVGMARPQPFFLLRETLVKKYSLTMGIVIGKVICSPPLSSFRKRHPSSSAPPALSYKAEQSAAEQDQD